MTALQLAIALGILTGAGIAGTLYALTPAQPDLADVLTRLTPATSRTRTTSTRPTPQSAIGIEERLGIWAQRTLPATLLGLPPAHDLAVLRMTPAQFYGKKITYAVVGLLTPLTVATIFRLLALPVPLAVPLAASLALAVILFFLPTRDIRTQARQARTDATRALSAYIELCALERNSGAGAAVALTTAADVGQSWIFTRISEELARARYTGHPPWDSLNTLADELALPELGEIADIMRLASDETAEVYRQLRSRSAALRSALLSAELEQANQIEERMYLPGSFIGVVFLAILITPALLRMLTT